MTKPTLRQLYSIGFVALVVAASVISIFWYVGISASCVDETLFINPRFACGGSPVIGKGEYRELRTRLQAYIAEEKDAGKLSEISIYFRDLDAGPTMGIDERKDYIPASLLKLPLAMTYYDMADDGTGESLDTLVRYTGETSVPDQTFRPDDAIQVGKSYTIEKLIEHMILYSDNAAAESLFEHLNDSGAMDRLSETYRDLGIVDAGSDLTLEAVNAKGYSSIFRQLYNVSFLSAGSSEKLLVLLAKSTFKDGLVAGVPGEVKVAHKFGERYSEDGVKQLHDCGIIYYPDNPYLLCVMTKGWDFSALEGVIATISRDVYNEVNSRRLTK